MCFSPLYVSPSSNLTHAAGYGAQASPVFLLSSSQPSVLTLGPPRVVVVENLPSLTSSSGPYPAVPLRGDPNPPSPIVSPSGASGNGVSPSSLVVKSKITGLDESQGGLTPPDVQAAAGKNTVVEAINAAAEIWYKNGTSAKEFSLSSFLGTNDFIGDPRIEYDVLSGHYFMSVADFYNNKVFIATTKTGNPLGTWFIYILQTTTNPNAFTDQPTMGVSGDKLAISANIYLGSGVSSYFFAINKADLIAGKSNPHYASEQSAVFSVHPVHNYSAENAMFFVSDQAGAVSTLYFFTLKGLPGVSNVTVSEKTFSITSAPEPPSAPQKGTSSQLNTDDGRMQDAAYLGGTIWLTFEDGCVPKHDSVDRACLRLIELNVTSKSVVQDFDVAQAKLYYFYPALSFTGNGGLIVIMGYSNSSYYPSIAITGQKAGAKAGTWMTPVTVLAGSSYDNDGRWGDYYAAQMDPVNTAVVWVAGQYEISASNWGTEIASASF